MLTNLYSLKYPYTTSPELADNLTLILWKILNLQLEICDEVHRRRFLNANCTYYFELEQEQGLIFPLRLKVELEFLLHFLQF